MLSTISIWHDARPPLAALDRTAWAKGKKELNNFKKVFQLEIPFQGEEAAEEAFVISNAPEEVLNKYQLHYAELFRKAKIHSLSVGDIVQVDGDFFLCEGSGWTML